VPPELADTNGYDFRNNMDGDTYVFVLGNTTDTWHASRKEFLSLSGPVPLVPDYAFGTWFTLCVAARVNNCSSLIPFSFFGAAQLVSVYGGPGQERNPALEHGPVAH
jgi:hypothetical protein